MSGLDNLIMALPTGWRFNVGHTPHWYRRDELPKHLRRRPFEAYVTNGEPIGTKAYVFESADGATPVDALRSALLAASARAQKCTSTNAESA